MKKQCKRNAITTTPKEPHAPAVPHMQDPEEPATQVVPKICDDTTLGTIYVDFHPLVLLLTPLSFFIPLIISHYFNW